jgi:hypothetical protein
VTTIGIYVVALASTGVTLRIRGDDMAREAIIQKVNPYELHGVRYYQIFLSYAETPDSVREVRLPHDAVYPSPSEGDCVTVETILSMVTEVKKQTEQA